MIIDFSALERAVAKLEKSRKYFHSEESLSNDDLREQFRAATVGSAWRFRKSEIDRWISEQEQNKGE